MSKDYITTSELIEFLTREGYRAIETTDSYGDCIEVHEGTVPVGSVRTDALYTLKVSACLPEEYRKRLLGSLYDYAKTPIDAREPRVYKLKILDTSLYLIHINEHETTVTTNKKAAKAYDDAGVYDAKVLAEKQGFALRAEVINATN